MPPRNLAPFIRLSVVESAKRICGNKSPLDNEPCSDCIYTVSRLHADFFSGLPQITTRMSTTTLCDAIRSAGLDG